MCLHSFVSGDIAKQKWKNLRDCYLRYKKNTRGATGQAKKYKKWPWSSHMAFLDDKVKFRTRMRNISEVTEIKDTNPPTSVTPPLMESNESDKNTLSSEPSKIPPPASPKKKLKSHCESSPTCSEVDQLIINYLETKSTRQQQLDRVDHLFLSYAETFKKFRPRTQAMVKLELATLFARTEMSELGEQAMSLETSSELSNNSLS